MKGWGKSPPASWRHGGSPNPVRCKANRFRYEAARPGTGLLPRGMVTPRQNPAYRPATEKALVTGLFLWSRFAGDSSGSPRGGLTAVSLEPPGAVARRGLAGRAGYEPLRNADRKYARARRPDVERGAAVAGAPERRGSEMTLR